MDRVVWDSQGAVHGLEESSTSRHFLEEERRVNNDWTIQYQGPFFQIRKENKTLPPFRVITGQAPCGAEGHDPAGFRGDSHAALQRAGHLLRGDRGSTETTGAGKSKQTPFNPSTGAASPLAGAV